MKYAILFAAILSIACRKKGNDQIIPITPESLTGVVIGPSEINLSWTDRSTNETGFKIERKTNTSAFQQIATVGQNTTTFNDKGLSLGTSYTYRVLSYNEIGNSISYSNEVTLTTFGLPTLTTTSITSIKNTAASSGGSITSDGGSTVTARGVIWSTSINPTITLTTKTIDGSGTGTFSSELTGLSPNTTYYVRSYATNSAGTAYGNELSFKTSNVDVTTGLVAYFPFNGNSNDESGNGNNGVVNGATLTTDKSGNVNKAYKFNGVSNSINVPHSTSLAIVGNMTISLWKKSEGNTGNYETFLAKRDASGNWNYHFGASHYFGPGGCPGEVNKYVSARRNNGGAQYELRFTDSLVTPSVNIWTHLTLSIENGLIKFYINGQPTGYSCFGNQFTIPAVDVGAPLTIGSILGGGEYFKGSLDEIRIYNRVLTQSEILYLFNN